MTFQIWLASKGFSIETAKEIAGLYAILFGLYLEEKYR